MEDVVKEVGVTRGAFYHYFKSREDLIMAVVDKMFYDNNPFEIAAKRTDLNALEKLRFALLEGVTGNTDDSSRIRELLKVVDNPVIFKSEFHSQLSTIAPYIEKLLTEGDKDGSMSVLFPKQAAEIIALLPNVWLSHKVAEISEVEFIDRVSFFAYITESIGVPIISDEIKQLILAQYKNVIIK